MSDNMRKGLPFLILFFSYQCLAQPSRWNFGIGLMNNAIAKPFTGKAGIVHSPFHFGIRGNVGYLLLDKERYQWVQKGTLGYIQQRLIHNVIQLYTENELNYKVYKGLHASGSLGAGYAHMINTPNDKVYKLNSDGEYVRAKKYGQPKFMGSFSLGFNYRWKTNLGVWQPALQYQFWVLAPFVKSYVPVLPNTALQIGITFQPSRKS